MPTWVKCVIGVSSGFSVLSLIAAAYAGATIGPWISFVVLIYSTQCATLAFGYQPRPFQFPGIPTSKKKE